MKKYIYIILACAAIFSFAACVENVEINPDENGPVYLSVSMEQPATKATIGESTGAFAFSNGDAIKIYNGNGVYTGTTTSTSAEGTFAMGSEFENTGSGFAGFPAGLVSTITGSGVTFILPASYEYAEVGSADPDAAKVPCPMMGDFTAGSKITLKQAGAVVRFRVTNIAAGSLSFTFPTAVTGEVTLSSVPSDAAGGILAANFINTEYVHPGFTVTVTNVPDVADGSYVFITIPVPTATAPYEILVNNTPDDGTNTRMVAIAGSSTGLNRAGGYKLAVRTVQVPTPSFKVADLGGGNYREVVLAPGNLMAKIGSFTNVVADSKPDGSGGTGKSYATASEWKFGGNYEFLGGDSEGGNYKFAHHDAGCVGKWVDLFPWQGASATIGHYQGLISVPGGSSDGDWLGTVDNESLYDGCWTTDTNNSSTPTGGKIYISNGGSYTWRPLTWAEWQYMLTERETQTFNEVENAHYAPVSVNGINGLLIFPDEVASVWNDASMGTKPKKAHINLDNKNDFQWGDASTYTSFNLVAMINAGFVFLPAAGFRSNPNIMNAGTFGYMWTSTGAGMSGSRYTAHYVEFKYNNSADPSSPAGGVAPNAAWTRAAARSVRLARELN